MKAEELMIGDWVNIVADDKLFPEELKGQIIPCKVIGFDDKPIVHPSYTEKGIDLKPQFGMMVKVANNFDYMYFVPERLSPISLTPEILEKNGLETDDGAHFSIQGQDNILELLLVELPFDGYTFDIVRTERTINKCNQRCYIDRYFASIDYVHQLQQALKLCGIEKEIVL